MSEMVQRVARAICASERVDPDCMVRHGPTRKKVPMWAVYEGRAKAALVAIREPTEAQLDVITDPRNEATRKCYADDWRAMAEAALA